MNADDDAQSTKDRALHGDRRRTARARRVALHLEIPEEARAAFFRRARAAGVSGPEYFVNAIAQPVRVYNTDAVRIAKPLTDVSYRIAVARDALQRGDLTAVAAHVEEIRRVTADALRPLASEHERDVRMNDDRAHKC